MNKQLVEALVNALFDKKKGFTIEETPFMLSFPASLDVLKNIYDEIEKVAEEAYDGSAFFYLYRETADILDRGAFDSNAHKQYIINFFSNLEFTNDHIDFHKFKETENAHKLELLFIRLYTTLHNDQSNEVKTHVTTKLLKSILGKTKLDSYYNTCQWKESGTNSSLSTPSNFITKVGFESTSFGGNTEVKVQLFNSSYVNFSSFWGINSDLIHYTNEEREFLLIKTLQTVKAINSFIENLEITMK